MDIQGEVAAAARACPEGLKTLHVLLDNLATHPHEGKYRSVSAEALHKRGLSPECFGILLLCGFEDYNGRFELHGPEPHNQPIYHAALQAIRAALVAGAPPRGASSPMAPNDGVRATPTPATTEVDTARVAAMQDSLVQMGFAPAQVQHALSQLPPGSDFDTVISYLFDGGMQVDTLPPEAAAPAPATSAGDPAAWECPICYSADCDHEWSCPNGHSFCDACMLHHIDAVPFPRCPLCEYKLCEEDFVELGVPIERLAAFRQAVLSTAVDTMAEDGDVLVRCSRPECANAVLMQREQRQMFCCSACDAEPFCTRCRQAPFHHHGSCEKVQELREQWAQWISGGREDYHGRARQAAQNDARNRALFEASQRHKELEADEQWKAQNCRLCPSCSRPISKVDGCDNMKCGENFHGGDRQPGCGTTFDWTTARPYVSQVRAARSPQLRLQHMQMRGRSVFHPCTECSLCGKQGISGLRFRCIHCPAFDVCPDCEPRLADFHEAAHVFEILFESEFRFSWLPRGTRVRIVRSGGKVPRSLLRGGRNEVEGKFGVISGRRRGPVEGIVVDLEMGEGQAILSLEFLEPVLTSQAEAEALLMKTMVEEPEDGTQAAFDPTQPQAPIDPTLPLPRGVLPVLPVMPPFHQDFRRAPNMNFADDSPLNSQDDMPMEAVRPRPKRRPAQRPRGRPAAVQHPTPVQWERWHRVQAHTEPWVE